MKYLCAKTCGDCKYVSKFTGSLFTGKKSLLIENVQYMKTLLILGWFQCLWVMSYRNSERIVSFLLVKFYFASCTGIGNEINDWRVDREKTTV